VSPTARSAGVLALLALSAIGVAPAAVALAVVALCGAVLVDARLARRVPTLTRTVPAVLSRAIPGDFVVVAEAPGQRAPRLRQATPPDLRVLPSEDCGRLEGKIVGVRRGRHLLPPVAARAEGPLGLAAWDHAGAGTTEVLVYPDLVTARRLALAVRQGRFRDPGRRARGPLGLGTELESIRDYQPDDDIRQLNWAATQRTGRPMSNTFRLEQDRDVVCLVDAGRLMAAPAGEGALARTRLDTAVDAAVAVALVADVLGDRVGAIAFDAELRRQLRPRHRGAQAVVESLFDIEPTSVDSDYELAFRTVTAGKRALVLVLCDLLDEAAGRALIDALPLLARRHQVIVASAADADLEKRTTDVPRTSLDVYGAAVALDVLATRRRVAARLRATGADLLETPADRLTAGCVGAYLRAKRGARL